MLVMELPAGKVELPVGMLEAAEVEMESAPVHDVCGWGWE